jgi:hypothetical protein
MSLEPFALLLEAIDHAGLEATRDLRVLVSAAGNDVPGTCGVVPKHEHPGE